jgi:hypothetical protein
MTVTVTVGDYLGNAFDANRNAVDLGYFWARNFFNELGLSIDPDGSGMVGDCSINDFMSRCERFSGASKGYAVRIFHLCKAGIEEGATRVSWA